MTTNNQNQIQAFGFGDSLVRTVAVNGESWFVARDVCACLDIDNNRDALSRLADDEKGVATTDTLGGRQEVAIISEAGLYRLIFTSRKAEAETFRRWVTHEVLPTIRKTGGYGVQPAASTEEIAQRAADIVMARLAISPRRAALPAVKPAIVGHEWFDGVKEHLKKYGNVTVSGCLKACGVDPESVTRFEQNKIGEILRYLGAKPKKSFSLNTPVDGVHHQSSSSRLRSNIRWWKGRAA